MDDQDRVNGQGDTEPVGGPGGDEVARLRDEVDRLTRMLASPESLSLEIDRLTGRTECSVSHWAARVLAASFADSLGDAPNWASVEVGPLSHGGAVMVVTVRRLGADTPERTVTKLREENERLREALAASGAGPGGGANGR